MFSFRLAAKLGKTRKQLMNEIDSHELSEWMAFDQLSPLDSDYRNEIAVGKVANILYSANRDPDRGDVLGLSDFVPQWGAEYRESIEAQKMVEIDPEEAIAKVRAGFASMRS